MAKVRVHELAKELGITSKDAVTKLQELGEFVRSASSTIEAPVVRKLRNAYPDAAAAEVGSSGGSPQASVATPAARPASRPRCAQPRRPPPRTPQHRQHRLRLRPRCGDLFSTRRDRPAPGARPPPHRLRRPRLPRPRPLRRRAPSPAHVRHLRLRPRLLRHARVDRHRVRAVPVPATTRSPRPRACPAAAAATTNVPRVRATTRSLLPRACRVRAEAAPRVNAPAVPAPQQVLAAPVRVVPVPHGAAGPARRPRPAGARRCTSASRRKPSDSRHDAQPHRTSRTR